MKRAGDPMSGGAAKRPGSGPPAGGSSSAARLTTSDALTYLRDVKNKFADRKDVYDTFLEIMKEFKAQRIDTAGVIQRVKDLFRGNKELILGFNTFLPKLRAARRPAEYLAVRCGRPCAALRSQGFEIQVHEVEDDEVRA
ncbi:paired amphipathic helix protein Sin3a [Monoraphidium neglectum]|uniref:Paired amphipathic helix protein Sin3a n=1 Tax=Monoraphidium neglectum TaxID=145388 RepID=A0A0D2LU17_9CHLO|nr:paired amphipathic helix protein Sin3a [Monoraphidium neglectum]KIY93141.1 paired amphipathic helix protein Sin3a [Monoraphidium neglectum]|eukprot:XP_013892161.1 paired amphipathic helix protein Sin3a [Monoraphidium neglectum]